MPSWFVAGTPLLEQARRGRYAVGAFNIANLESAQAVLAAAEQQRAPAWLQVTQTTAAYAPLAVLKALVDALARQTRARVPVCLHLDHGKDLGTVRCAVKAGFSSVMMDGSRYPFSKNVRLTRAAVKIAHARGVSVEGELGALGRPGETPLTRPHEAARFVEATGCDFLAVAVGTSHGAYKFRGRARVDTALVREIANAAGVPLVLHGASRVDPRVVARLNRFGGALQGARGLPDAVLRRAVQAGICKVNIDTDNRLAFTAGVRAFLASKPAAFDPRAYLAAGRSAMQRAVAQKMRVLGCAGQARARRRKNPSSARARARGR